MKPIKWISLFMMGCAVLIGTASCGDDDNNKGELILSVPTVTDITVPTATAVSEVTVCQDDIDSGNIRVMAYGFCYGTTTQPTIYDATVKATPENGKMTASLTDLENNTVYHIRAFATLYPNGVVYSDVVIITAGIVEESATE